MKTFDLGEYLSNGVEKIVKGIMKASLKNPKQSLFLLQYAKDSKKARTLRKQKQIEGKHIPPFLISSITNQCNLHCKGCYARANHSCHDVASESHGILTSEQWSQIFTQAAELGIEFILLAGGEPLMRKDVLIEAGKHRNILFPIFTNGTLLNEEYIQLYAKNRNLIPILSIEGQKETTDERRGVGVYDKLCDTMQSLHNHGILFGASVTVNQRNAMEVTSEGFMKDLAQRGCKGVVFVEYVPVDSTANELALDEDMRQYMLNQINELRQNQQELVLIAFPGDEKSSGGCLAAGRGFFHINAHGGAEPCPFSPYSDTSLKEVTLEEALRSPLFQRLQENGNLEQEHIGGCVLFEQKDIVQRLLGGNRYGNKDDNKGTNH